MQMNWIVAKLALAVSVFLMVQNTFAQDESSSEVADQPAFQAVKVVLYNSTTEFEKRSPTAAVIGAFIKRIQAAASELWAGKEREAGKSGLIAVAI